MRTTPNYMFVLTSDNPKELVAKLFVDTESEYLLSPKVKLELNLDDDLRYVSLSKDRIGPNTLIVDSMCEFGSNHADEELTAILNHFLPFCNLIKVCEYHSYSPKHESEWGSYTRYTTSKHVGCVVTKPIESLFNEIQVELNVDKNMIQLIPIVVADTRDSVKGGSKDEENNAFLYIDDNVVYEKICLRLMELGFQHKEEYTAEDKYASTMYCPGPNISVRLTIKGISVDYVLQSLEQAG